MLEKVENDVPIVSRNNESEVAQKKRPRFMVVLHLRFQCKNLGVLWMFSLLFCLNKLVKFAFLKKVLVRVFFMKKHFSAENVFVFQLFLHITLFFYKHSVFFFFFQGQLCLRQSVSQIYAQIMLRLCLKLTTCTCIIYA